MLIVYPCAMKTLSRIIIFLFIVLDVFLVGKLLLTGKNIQILNPAGYIALQERNLLYLCVFIMVIVVVPVFIFAIHVAKTYHEDNKNAQYTPDWDHSTKLQAFLWAFPTFVILILCVINWVSAHKLDPHNELINGTKPMVIQVVALRWKWLFIYPGQGVASVNNVVFPEKTPITFEITASDTPMNSFWIPQLDGQIYAMAGMATQTHLIADTEGVYRGSSGEIDGQGFADMTFSARSVTQGNFDAWVERVKQSPQALTTDSFNDLNQPTQNVPPEYFSSTETNLYTTIVMKYMAHPSESADMQSMPETNLQTAGKGGS
jgi:cytochrome o ubiquinol oxidase subunit 2